MILENDAGIEVVGEAGEMNEALEIIARELPDIILLDLLIGTGDSIDAIRSIVELDPAGHILVLTGSEDEELHRRALLNGAHGMLKKSQVGAVLLTAIKKVHQGEAWVDRILTAELLRETRSRDREKDSIDQKIASLTAREQQIVRHIAAGLSNKAIGERMNISEKTIRNRLTVIFEKLDLTSRLELAIFASQNGLDNSANG